MTTKADGYLIENGALPTIEPVYLIGTVGGIRWTTNKQIATRFVRKQDAEGIAKAMFGEEHTQKIVPFGGSK